MSVVSRTYDKLTKSRKVRRRVGTAVRIASATFFLASLALSFFGLSTHAFLEALFGHTFVAALGHWRHNVLHMTPNEARWFFVVTGILFYSIAGALWLFLPNLRLMDKLQDFQEKREKQYAESQSRIEELRRDFAQHKEVANQVFKIADIMTARADAKLRDARSLHRRTREMLIKWRRLKDDDNG